MSVSEPPVELPQPPAAAASEKMETHRSNQSCRSSKADCDAIACPVPRSPPTPHQTPPSHHQPHPFHLPHLSHLPRSLLLIRPSSLNEKMLTFAAADMLLYLQGQLEKGRFVSRPEQSRASSQRPPPLLPPFHLLPPLHQVLHAFVETLRAEHAAGRGAACGCTGCLPVHAELDEHVPVVQPVVYHGPGLEAPNEGGSELKLTELK